MVTHNCIICAYNELCPDENSVKMKGGEIERGVIDSTQCAYNDVTGVTLKWSDVTPVTSALWPTFLPNIGCSIETFSLSLVA